jgi:acyl carrier protein
VDSLGENFRYRFSVDGFLFWFSGLGGFPGLVVGSWFSGGGTEPMANDLSDRIQSIVADQLGVELADVTKDASILDDLGADSLDVVELVMTLEEAFDIEVPDDAVEEMRTIGDIQRFVESHVS